MLWSGAHLEVEVDTVMLMVGATLDELEDVWWLLLVFLLLDRLV